MNDNYLKIKKVINISTIITLCLILWISVFITDMILLKELSEVASSPNTISVILGFIGMFLVGFFTSIIYYISGAATYIYVSNHLKQNNQ